MPRRARSNRPSIRLYETRVRAGRDEPLRTRRAAILAGARHPDSGPATFRRHSALGLCGSVEHRRTNYEHRYEPRTSSGSGRASSPLNEPCTSIGSGRASSFGQPYPLRLSFPLLFAYLSANPKTSNPRGMSTTPTARSKTTVGHSSPSPAPSKSALLIALRV